MSKRVYFRNADGVAIKAIPWSASGVLIPEGAVSYDVIEEITRDDAAQAFADGMAGNEREDLPRSKGGPLRRAYEAGAEIGAQVSE